MVIFFSSNWCILSLTFCYAAQVKLLTAGTWVEFKPQRVLTKVYNCCFFSDVNDCTACMVSLVVIGQSSCDACVVTYPYQLPPLLHHASIRL